jgi:hypothetical protein
MRGATIAEDQPGPILGISTDPPGARGYMVVNRLLVLVHLSSRSEPHS